MKNTQEYYRLEVDEIDWMYSLLDEIDVEGSSTNKYTEKMVKNLAMVMYKLKTMRGVAIVNGELYEQLKKNFYGGKDESDTN